MAHSKGMDFIVSVKSGGGFVAVAGQRSVSLERNMETMETTTKDSNGYKEFVSGLKDWSISADGVIINSDAGFNALEEAYVSGEEVEIQISTGSSSNYTGKAIITSFPIEAPYDDLATYSLSFQGTGALTKA